MLDMINQQSKGNIIKGCFLLKILHIESYYTDINETQR